MVYRDDYSPILITGSIQNQIEEKGRKGIEEELQFARALCVNVLIETELKNHQRFIWHKGRKRTHIRRTQSLAAPREADR